MSPQKFKTMVANDVINAENASLKTMNTDQLFDLFTSADTKKVCLTPISLFELWQCYILNTTYQRYFVI